MREALFRLEREGYLQVHAKSGWSVRPLDFDLLDDFYDLRIVLEGAAVERLCAGDPRRALSGLEKIWLVPPRRRMEKTLAPTLRAGLKILGDLELKPLMAQALHMGDEVHNRNVAASSLLIKRLVPALLKSSAPASDVPR